MATRRIARAFTSFVAVSWALLPVAQPAQGPSRITLGRPSAAPATRFSSITGLIELSPGQLLVADGTERRLVLLDLASAATRDLSRIGSGPREFRSIGERLIPRPGGVYVVDVVQRRLLPIRADGTIEDAIAFPGVSLLPVASDRSGRVFGDVMIFNGRVLSDSMRVVRWDLSRNRLDTLLTYDAGRAGMISRGGEARQVYRTTTSWTVLPDGGWISLHAGSYALTEWREGMPPRVVRLPLAAAPITQGDKDAYIAAQSAEPGRQLGQAGAQPSGRPRPEAIWSFPARFPAFDADTPLLRAPDGMLWIRRLHGVRETQPVYDLILPAGRLVAQLATSPGSEVVGFGVGVVYLSHRDADGLHTITRHPLPDLPQQP